MSSNGGDKRGRDALRLVRVGLIHNERCRESSVIFRAKLEYAYGKAGVVIMTGEELVDLRAWCTRQREYLQMQREMLRSGTFRIVRQDGSGPIDESKQSIDWITNNIAELDLILAAYDKRQR